MSINERLANQRAHIKQLYERIADLQEKVKKLEQKDSYYPTKEETRNIKIGLTD